MTLQQPFGSVLLSHSADLLILGGGPSGLYAAYCAGMRGMSVALLDSAPMLGGQLSALYPEKSIYDIPGFPSVQAEELANRLIDQAMAYQPDVYLGEVATGLHRTEQGWEVSTDQRCYRARAVLICGGIGAVQPKRLPPVVCPVPEIRGIRYHLDNLTEYAGQLVAIIGGQHQSVSWTNKLAGIARQVWLIHRKDHFWAPLSDVQRLTDSAVVIRTPYELVRVHGSSDVESVTIRHLETYATEVLPVSRVLINSGYASTLKPLSKWGLTLQGSTVKVDPQMHTNLPGIFAAGDICSYPGKIKLLAVAFGEAAMAVNHAYCYLNPSANPFPGHSSNLPPPLEHPR